MSVGRRGGRETEAGMGGTMSGEQSDDRPDASLLPLLRRIVSEAENGCSFEVTGLSRAELRKVIFGSDSEQ